MQDAIQTIQNITDGIKPIAPVLAGLVLVVIGLLWTFAKDPQKKKCTRGGWSTLQLALALFIWLPVLFLG
ncbi:pilin [Lentibacillus amyloliquefaciens]|uniref:pilin n=1 Tax=Lentibacillus amyloliquefaciens TaxID=1472767 RepID=UPI001F1AD9E0|nr:pilin [Lentibacillus amyloliquefaciens]